MLKGDVIKWTNILLKIENETNYRIASYNEKVIVLSLVWYYFYSLFLDLFDAFRDETYFF